MTRDEILALPIAHDAVTHPALIARFELHQMGGCNFEPEVAFEHGIPYIAADGWRVPLVRTIRYEHTT
jgi:hypothetical protein